MRAGELNDSAPVVVGGTVYAVGREVAAFDAATGAQRWHTPIGGSSFATPAVGDGLVVAGATTSGIVALDAATGAIVWQHPVKSYNSSSITINGDRVFVTVADGLLALRLQAGDVLWSKTYQRASAPARRRRSPAASCSSAWAAPGTPPTTPPRAHAGGAGP